MKKKRRGKEAEELSEIVSLKLLLKPDSVSVGRHGERFNDLTDNLL